MTHQNLLLTLAGASLLTLTSCKNPADETTDATIGEAAPATQSDGGTTYLFNDNSTIGFVGSKVTGTKEGGFKTFYGNFEVKEGEPQSGSFTIDMNSTWSEADKLTAHLKNADFFDVAKFPESNFVVTKFEKTSETSYHLSGNLTLHGITKNITFPTTVTTSDEQITVKAEFDINRADFGIIYEGKKDDLIRDEVIIKLDLEANKVTEVEI